VILTPQPHGLQRHRRRIRLARVALRGTPKERTGVLRPHDLLVEAVTAEAGDVATRLASQLLAAAWCPTRRRTGPAARNAIRVVGD